jgi:ribosomal protein S17E
MSLPIYIPSMGRAGALFEKISTLSFIRTGAELVVPPEEAQRYRNALFNSSREDVVVLECPEKGIAKVRHWIGLLAKRRKQPKFAMIDDDLNFAVRISEENNKLRPQVRKDTDEMLAWVETALSDYAHVGVSPRDAAKTETVAFGPVPLTLLNKRTLRFLAYRTDDFLSVEHGRVEVMEDFDVNLQLIRSGRPNIQSYWWTNDQRQTGSPGGCASYRSLQVQDESARKLAEMHAPFVTLRFKENKGAVVKSAREMQKRTEVTIYWEKAYASTQTGKKK